ncbi:MAG: hypothetical protein ACOCUH_00255, partial [Bacteriovoracia bacterium]
MYELIGYLASLAILISLSISNIKLLRIVNLLGAALFVVYGVLIDSWPVAIMNGLIVIVDIYYLWQFAHKKEYFKVNTTLNKDTFFVKTF